MIFSEPGFKGPIWEARVALLPDFLKEKKLLPVEREVGVEEERLLHLMFLKKAIEEVLVSILCYVFA